VNNTVKHIFTQEHGSVLHLSAVGETEFTARCKLSTHTATKLKISHNIKSPSIYTNGKILLYVAIIMITNSNY